MAEPEEIATLLTEIRDAQREQLAEYKRVTGRSLELQEKAVARQEQMALFYRRVAIFALLVIAFIIVLIVYLLGKIR